MNLHIARVQHARAGGRAIGAYAEVREAREAMVVRAEAGTETVVPRAKVAAVEATVTVMKAAKAFDAVTHPWGRCRSKEASTPRPVSNR